MKKPFTVGERVRVYGYKFGGFVTDGEIIEIDGSDMVIVHLGGEGQFPVHPKQCRRLKPKKLRRIWVKKSQGEIRDGESVRYRFWDTEVSDLKDKPEDEDFKDAVLFEEVIPKR